MQLIFENHCSRGVKSNNLLVKVRKIDGRGPVRKQHKFLSIMAGIL